VEEEYIGDDGGLEDLRGSGSYSVETVDVSKGLGRVLEVNLHTGSHEDAVGGCFGTNNVAGEADHLRSKIYRSTTKGSRDRCPKKVSNGYLLFSSR
jgi:hypothetical protein